MILTIISFCSFLFAAVADLMVWLRWRKLKQKFFLIMGWLLLIPALTDLVCFVVADHFVR
jgi:predicted membrane channel-forming protein YqfA (hemolysin III family)